MNTKIEKNLVKTGWFCINSVLPALVITVSLALFIGEVELLAGQSNSWLRATLSGMVYFIVLMVVVAMKTQPVAEKNEHAAEAVSYVHPPRQTNAVLELDIHAWLLHRESLVLKKDTAVSWSLLYSQFGEGFPSDEQGRLAFKVKFLGGLANLAELMPSLAFDESANGLVFHRIPRK